MKEVNYYQCETCGTNYAEAAKCQECEAFHVAVSDVPIYKYNAKGMGPESKYPHAVILKMADGKQIVFKR